MGLDIRVPIGLLFLVLGALLAGRGVFGDPAIYRRSLGINVNLWWGLALLAFGALMFLGGYRKSRPPAGGRSETAEPGTPHPGGR